MRHFYNACSFVYSLYVLNPKYHHQDECQGVRSGEKSGNEVQT